MPPISVLSFITDREAIVADIVYTWDEAGVYAGALELDDSYTDPLDPSVRSAPRNSTRYWPPEVGERQAARINPDGKTWSVVPDWRGFTYWTADRSSGTISVLGVEPPEGFLSSDPGPSMDDLKSAKHAQLRERYGAAVEADVVYTSLDGTTQIYQADQAFSVANLSQMILANQAVQSVPGGFYWVAKDNTKVPFLYADLLGLAKVIGDSGFAAYVRWQELKAQVDAAATPEEIEAVVW